MLIHSRPRDGAAPQIRRRDAGTARQPVRTEGANLRYHKEKSFIDKAAEVTGTVLRDGKILMPNRQHKKLWVANKELRMVKDEKAKVKLKKRIRGLNAQASQFRKVNEEFNKDA